MRYYQAQQHERYFVEEPMSSMSHSGRLHVIEAAPEPVSEHVAVSESLIHAGADRR